MSADGPGGARAVLEAERRGALELAAALERELASAVEAAAGAGADDEHDPEGSTTAFERAQTSAVLEQVRARLAALDAALERLDGPDAGTCRTCGGPVGAERLAVRPWAEQCVRCAGASQRR
ncbi:TraR/DksA C4-type zinc finger protein [Kineococcus terrestris]|uniref:TraR/DksA C4-type zinc finger protein n=1 Tax=Kineococcus terrestris TaxID=2044856 RepID=UPI0034DB2DEF